MKRLTIALLAISVFTPTVFAQCVQQKELKVEIIRGTDREYQNVSTPTVFVQSSEQTDRQRIFSGWLEMVKGAERDYKNKNGRYGDLAALRKTRLLHSLVFESGSSAAPNGRSQATFVPKSTLFQVTVSSNGQHFRAVVGDKCVTVDADDTQVYLLEVLPGRAIRDFQDGPEGPIVSVAR